MAVRITSRRTAIGLEIGGRLINAAQLRRARNGWHVEAATSIKRTQIGQPISSDEAHRVADILDRQGFVGREVVLCLPNDKLMTSLLDLPPRDSGAPLAEIVRVELASAHKLEAQEIEVAFWDRPDPVHKSSGSSAIAVGCTTASATSLLDAIESTRLRVGALDVQSWALARALSPFLMASPGLAAVLTVDWTGAHLIVLFGTVVVYERSLGQAGLQHLHDLLADTLGLDLDVADYLLREMGLREDTDEEQHQEELLSAVRECIIEYLDKLASEMRLSLTYVTQEYGRQQVDRLIVLGEGALIPGLADRLAGACSLTARILPPAKLGGEARVARSDCDSPVMTTAFGLAQYPGGRSR